MPSLGDVANEVKALLEDVKSNTSTIKGHTNSIKNDTASIKNDASAIKANTATIINELTQLDSDMKNGFVNLAQGLQVLMTLGIQANQLLAENNEQNRTVICWLTNIANTLCDIKRNTDKEVALQTNLSSTLHHIDDIGQLVHSREAMDVANHYELEERMNKCCPLEQEPIRPCFDQCVAPKPIKFAPVKTDWTPVKYSSPKNPSAEVKRQMKKRV